MFRDTQFQRLNKAYPRERSLNCIDALRIGQDYGDDGVRKRRVFKEYDRLLLTNPVEWASLQFQSILNHVANDGDVPSILTIRIEGYFGRHVIIDGNHRAVAYAYLKKPIRFFEIRSDHDIDRIIQIEARGGFSGFPHRSFLTQDTTYEQLLHDAIVAMAREMKTCSAQDRALEFRGEDRKRQSPEYVREQREQVRREIERYRLVPVNYETQWQQEYSAHNVSAKVSETYRVKKSHSNRHRSKLLFSEHPTNPSADDDVRRWFTAIFARFGDLNGSEFPCAYSEIARLCDEESSRGPTIAKKLQQADLLEHVRVGDIDTGESYSNGRPMKQRITFWRLKSINSD